MEKLEFIGPSPAMRERMRKGGELLMGYWLDPELGKCEVVMRLPRRCPDTLELEMIDPDSPDPFEQFWQQYPRKVAKHTARLKFNRLSRVEQRAVLDHIGKRIWPKDKQYIPHPSTFLNQRRWEDEDQPTTVGVQDDIF